MDFSFTCKYSFDRILPMTKEGKIFTWYTAIYAIVNFLAFQVEIIIHQYDKIFRTNYYSDGVNNLFLWIVFHFSSLFITLSLLLLFFMKKKLLKIGISKRCIIFWKIILLLTYLALFYETGLKFILPKIFFNFILFSVYVHPQNGLLYRTNFSTFFLFVVTAIYVYRDYVRDRPSGC